MTFEQVSGDFSRFLRRKRNCGFLKEKEKKKKRLDRVQIAGHREAVIFINTLLSHHRKKKKKVITKEE